MEVDRKFQQKKVLKKTRQIAGAIPGWIDAASTSWCIQPFVKKFSLKAYEEEILTTWWRHVFIHTVVANWDETAVKLKCRKNHWEYENIQYTIEKSVESATRNAKKIF